MALHPMHRRLERGEMILMDGALGTELERRGVATPLPLWSARALLDDPDTLRRIHEDYVRAGADLIATATFRTTPRVMRKAGRPESDADRLTEAAVRIAVEARDRAGAGLDPDSGFGAGRTVWIGGSMAPLEACYRPEDAPPCAEMEREHADHAARLKRAGAEVLLLETMNNTGEAVVAARAAASTGLGFTVSFICKSAVELLSGESLADAVRAVEPLKPLAILVNC